MEDKKMNELSDEELEIATGGGLICKHPRGKYFLLDNNGHVIMDLFFNSRENAKTYANEHGISIN